MAQVRDTVLDHACEDLAEIRERKNGLSTDERNAIGSALQRMQQRGTTGYKHAGIELSRVPGADKLRVRLTKDEGDSSVEGGTISSTNPGHDDDDAPDLEDVADDDTLSIQ